MHEITLKQLLLLMEPAVNKMGLQGNELWPWKLNCINLRDVLTSTPFRSQLIILAVNFRKTNRRNARTRENKQ